MRLIKTICLDEETFREAMNLASRQPLVAVDTEFHKEEQWGKARIIGVSWGFPMGSDFYAYYAPFRHGLFPTVVNLDPTLIQEFNRITGTHIYHNFIADYQVFMHEGVDVSKRYIYDTMVAAHLVDENERSFSLDSLSWKYFKARKANLKDLEKDYRWDQIHPLVMGEYACIDVFLTYRQYLRTRAGLQQQELENLYEDYQQFIKTLARVVGRGLHINEKLAISLREEGLKELQSIQSKLGFKPSSQQLVGKTLHERYGVPVRFRTNKGAPSTSSLHLRRYADMYPEVKEFVDDVLQYRSTYKAVSTWYQGFLDKRATDGLLHPGLTIVGGGSDDTGGTVTGRLSCRSPNLQQIPRRGPARSLFIDPPGYRLVECDYSQAELRLIGYYLEKVGDSTVADAYRTDQDIHSISAEKMKLTEVLPYKDARQVGKTCNFSLCYRAGADQLKTILYRDGGLDVDLPTARSWHQAWHASYPGVALLNEKAQKQAEAKGYVKMFNGRRRHLRERSECFKAFNSIIQGGVGQVLVYALIALEKAMPDLQIVLTVHDSVLFYIKENEVDRVVPHIIQCMEEIPTRQFDMPFKVDWKYYSS
jgi:DNA polymerase I